MFQAIVKPTFWPLKYSRHISSSFGMRMHPINKEKKFHRGIDIKARNGSPVFATAEGKVIKTSYDDKNGKYIRIQHKEGFISSYMHLSSILIKEGENISGGEVIGKVGNTGKSTAPHLHFEVSENGKYVDPSTFF